MAFNFLSFNNRNKSNQILSHIVEWNVLKWISHTAKKSKQMDYKMFELISFSVGLENVFPLLKPISNANRSVYGVKNLANVYFQFILALALDCHLGS